MTASRLETRQGSHPWIAYAAACWALIFGAFHIVWAAGWYVGLDPAQSRAAFAKPWMLAYDLVVAAMCIIGVPVALALGMPWGRRVPRRLLSTLAWAGTCLLVLRAVASLVQAAYLMITGQFALRQLGIWEPWFYAGAVLFGLDLWRYWRRPKAGAG
jgi:hypothetical protein